MYVQVCNCHSALNEIIVLKNNGMDLNYIKIKNICKSI